MQMPHVSWNTALHRWLMVFASNVAFHAAASADGIHFGPPIEIMRLPAFHMKPGEIFTAYPTLLSPDKATQMVTGREGFLYFAPAVGSPGGDVQTTIGAAADPPLHTNPPEHREVATKRDKSLRFRSSHR